MGYAVYSMSTNFYLAEFFGEMNKVVFLWTVNKACLLLSRQDH